MHEFSIASALVDQLQRIAAEQRATRIIAVEVHCGVMQQVVPEALRLAFEATSTDTPAAGATLTIVEEGLVARCRACDVCYAAAIDDYACPRCRQADVELLAGRDIVLRTVTCETQDGVAV
ncbi:MAG TPA: hydrogenase maturation nickel metallochaperone HypA [Phycisphaerae bacterium]|nr:hydrogenase maturation nickel metallochaperone HypA [Phycisphaerae bacterium]HQL54364.1 hydrogenase maturation nickel metallochaperone HypA [Phycisphaerae bacterium]